MAAKAATTPAGGAFSLAVSAGAAEADVPSQKFSLGGDITPPAKPSAPADKSSYEPVPTMEKRKMRIVDAEGKVHEREVSVPRQHGKGNSEGSEAKAGARTRACEACPPDSTSEDGERFCQTLTGYGTVHDWSAG
jgi:hypothetical protein